LASIVGSSLPSGRPSSARAPHLLERVPGHHHLRGGVGAELQMQPGDRRRCRLIGRGRGGGCAGAYEGRCKHGDPGGGKQRAAFQSDSVVAVFRGHGGRMAPKRERRAYRSSMTVRRNCGSEEIAAGRAR
jgi:hypothetical protein